MLNVVRASLRLPAESSSPREARQFVDRVLHQWRRDGAIDRTALIASELVTNAMRHSKAEVVVHLEGRDECVYLEVEDTHALEGLGLPIVEALASSWGVRRDHEGVGEAVWAEVRG